MCKVGGIGWTLSDEDCASGTTGICAPTKHLRGAGCISHRESDLPGSPKLLLLVALPKAKTAEDFENLLPWRIAMAER
jgi:hypothetical protein